MIKKMNNLSVVPRGSNRIRSILFFVLVYVSTSLIFTIFATFLSLTNLSITWILLFVLLIASILLTVVYKRYYYNFTYPSVAELKSTDAKEELSQCQITFQKRDDFLSFTSDIETAIKNLASVLKTSSDSIKLIEVIDAADAVKLSMPSKALDRLIFICEADLPVTKSLGICYVNELVVESYNISNIRRLFSHGFRSENLQSFLSSHYPALIEYVSLQKKHLIDELLKHAIKEDSISRLLQLARQSNPKAYIKYGPYYKVPRITFDKSRLEAAQSALRQKKVRRAQIMGTGLSAFGSALIIFLYLFVAIITDSGFLAAWVWLLLVPLARTVTRGVEKNLRGESEDLISKVAVRSYLIGFFLSPLLIVTALFLIVLIILSIAVLVSASTMSDAFAGLWDFILLLIQLAILLEGLILERLVFDTLLLLGSLSYGCYLAFKRR